ncbi:MAG: hypothetical protein ACRD44_02420 [Bryobacteraceae bacterium]
MISAFDKNESRILRRLKTPFAIQRFLDYELGYNKEPDGPTCRSPRRVMRDHLAHCMEGALMAAAALAFHRFPPLLVDLKAVDDDDHVLAVYRRGGCWGAVAMSNYSGLRSREPVYRGLRELVMSYFEHYYSLRGRKTLRSYSRPVNLRRFAHLPWTTSEEDVWEIPEHLVRMPHTPLLTRTVERRLSPVDRRLSLAGLVGSAE